MELISLLLYNNLNEAFFLTLILLCTTSFLRISILFGFIKVGLGLEGLAGSLWSFILSLALCLIVSTPVFDNLEASLTKAGPGSSLQAKNTVLLETLRTSLETRVSPEDLNIISSQSELGNNATKLRSLNLLIPAYVLSELKQAFKLGLKLLLPFLVIDLIVAHIFTALGIVTLSSFSLSFCLKVVLLASVGGWDLIVKNILSS